MSSISLAHFDNWLKKYGKAWEKGDPDATEVLFTSDAHYYETPFDPPMIGLEAIYKYWNDNAVSSQEGVHFSYSVLAVNENVGLAHWRVLFKRLPSGKSVTLDGIFKVEFAEDGRCKIFREWWHRIEKPPSD
jgi:hypothetical protein